jgi:acetoin utilization protein AcuB
MIVRNWMKKDLVTLSSDALVSEARELIRKHNIRYLPVVDDGVLRGILRLRDLFEAATHVAATQRVYELDYFNKRLKVKDLMIRWPKTIDSSEPVDSAMKKGEALGMSFFPVVDQGKLVGSVSYEEIFETFSQILGVRENWTGITLDGLEVGPGTLTRVAEAVDETGAVVHSIFTLRLGGGPLRKVIVRLETDRLDAVLAHLRAKGYQIIEVENPQPGG